MSDFITSVPMGLSPAVDGFNLLVAGLTGDRETADAIIGQREPTDRDDAVRFMGITGFTTGMLVSLLRLLPPELSGNALGLLRASAEDVGTLDQMTPEVVLTAMDSAPLGRAEDAH
jgi:hypothetical protein